MALICSTCLAVVAQTQNGRCAACHRPYECARRPSSAQRDSTEYRRNRKTVMAGDPTCVYCGERATTVDHVQPRMYGGSDELSNLVPACLACNVARGNRMRHPSYQPPTE